MSKRYDLSASPMGSGYSMQESKYGNWVTWGEHYKLEAELQALRDISNNGNLSWQDKHIAAWKILNKPEGKS